MLRGMPAVSLSLGMRKTAAVGVFAAIDLATLHGRHSPPGGFAMTVRLMLVLLLTATTGFADEVFLRGGGRVSGVIVERSLDSVTVEVGPGRVRIAADRIERIDSAPSALGEYQQRASRLAPDDVEGWIALAEWARGAELETQSREALERVLNLSPGNEKANRALGKVPNQGQWMTQEEVYRSKGLVPFEGSWISPSDKAKVEASRAGVRAAELRAAAAEDERRAREAEARKAEAAAREAEAQTQSGAWGWGYGGAPCGWPGGNCPPPGDWTQPEEPSRPPKPEPLPPAPPPPTSSVNAPAQKTPGTGKSMR